MRIEELTLSEWEDALPSNGYDVFHSVEVLEVLDEHATEQLRLFGGYQGQELVGLFPLFTREVLFGRALISPPPGFGIPRLGPLVMTKSPKRRKQEQKNREFIRTILDAVDADDPFTLFATVCSPEFDDPRPFKRAGYNVEPNFTYSLDLTDTTPDQVLSSFSSDLRDDVQDGEDLDIDVSVRGPDAAMRVYDAYKARFAEEGIDFPVPRDYTYDLVEELDDRARVYVAETPDGEFLSGRTYLFSNDIAYSWQGGTRTYYEGVGVGGLLDWHLIRDILTDPELESVSRYDLGGASTEKLARHKSQFNPDLLPYYEIKSGLAMRLAKKAYLTLTY